MTMADAIAVMNEGRIEQLGTPSELYERPRSAFVAGFLGASNLLSGRVDGGDRVRLDVGDVVRVPSEALSGRTGRVAVGIRPEKMRLGPPGEGENMVTGSILDTAYVGVSTQYLVSTGAGELSAYVQNANAAEPPLPAGKVVTLSWNPEATFVVDAPQEENG